MVIGKHVLCPGKYTEEIAAQLTAGPKDNHAHAFAYPCPGKDTHGPQGTSAIRARDPTLRKIVPACPNG
ncbi:MAG: hypothetical protein AMXMBFR84_14310 [Candidatus Hydrogenedentota bacterium]